MTPEEYCQDKAARSGSSFYYSFLFLPPRRRLAITALYAFCREVDDVVDETPEASVAQIQLDWWRNEVADLFKGKPNHKVTLALRPHLEQCRIDEARLIEIIDGMQMDLTQTRYLDFAGLRLYCHRVAGVVGSLAADIFSSPNEATLNNEVRPPALRSYAELLGLAFQLTNIIRDVGEDARRGRVYLPIDDLQRFNITAAQLLNAEKHRNDPIDADRAELDKRFAALMAFQTKRARETYEAAFSHLRTCTTAQIAEQRAGLMMAAIYLKVLREVELDGFQVLKHRIALTPIRKLWLAWKVWMFRKIPAVDAAA
jgi:15-cis-phytoene synthase